MATNNFLPGTTVQQLLHANKIFQECTIVVGNEGVTSEAKEPDRKRSLLQQLKNAKRLRYVMEMAETKARNASTAEEARRILISCEKDVYELVSLTEAVRGGYTLSKKGYHSFSVCQVKETKLDEASMKHGKKVISDHLRAMARERTELESKRVEKKAAAVKQEVPSIAFGVTTQQERLATNQEDKSPDCFHVEKGAAAVLFGMHVNTNNQHEADEADEEMGDADKLVQKRKHGLEVIPAPVEDISPNVSTSDDDRKKSFRSYKPNEPLKHLLFQSHTVNEDSPAAENMIKQNSAADSSKAGETPSAPGTKFPSGPFYYPAPLNPFLNPINPNSYKVEEKNYSLLSNNKGVMTTKKRKQTFKCHSCKELSDETMRCNLTRLNGSKCTKQFCRSCLTNRYKVTDFESLKDDKSWQCPACLGTCLCMSCLKARERKRKVTVKRHKCHDCKESSTEYVRCNYWQPTGNKCNKYFCKNCIAKKYNSNPVVDEKEWHCPACLGTCECKACVKVREKKNRESLERRSGRGPNYGYYSMMNGGV